MRRRHVGQPMLARWHRFAHFVHMRWPQGTHAASFGRSMHTSQRRMASSSEVNDRARLSAAELFDASAAARASADAARSRSASAFCRKRSASVSSCLSNAASSAAASSFSRKRKGAPSPPGQSASRSVSERPLSRRTVARALRARLPRNDSVGEKRRSAAFSRARSTARAVVTSVDGCSTASTIAACRSAAVLRRARPRAAPPPRPATCAPRRSRRAPGRPARCGPRRPRWSGAPPRAGRSGRRCVRAPPPRRWRRRG